MHRATIRTYATLATAASIAACSDSGSPSTGGQVNFNLATKAASAPAAAARSMSFATVGTPETFTDGSNTLVIDQVQLVLREIELKRADATANCGESPSSDGCEKLELGPVLLDLPLGGTGGAARSFSVPVPAGTYREIEFQIHKPSHDDDAAFVQANPDFDGVSVKVTGTYQKAGDPAPVSFAYTTDLEAEEEIELNPPLVTTESAATDLTLFVDLDRWFRDGTGALVDPASANIGNPNETLVENNITGTLHAFEDENEDGADDHGGDRIGSDD
jgi:hypothetical protein